MKSTTAGVGLWIALATLGACGGAPIPPPQVQNPTPDAHAPDWQTDQDLLALRMRSLETGLGATGFVPTDFARRGFLATSARSTYQLEVAAGRCLTVVALGAAGVTDLDAGIFEVDGRAVAQDAAADARPILQACASRVPRTLYYVLHAYRGNGAFLIVAFDGPGRAVSASSEADGGREGVGSGAVDHSDWTTALVRRGFEPEGPPVEFDVSPDRPVRLSLPVVPGRCVAVVAHAQAGVLDVNLRILDEAGDEQRGDGAPRSWAGVQLCPENSGVYSVVVSSARGQGLVQLGRFSARSSQVGGERAMWLGDRVMPPTKRTGPPTSAVHDRKRVPVAGRLSPGGAVEHRLRLLPGRCTSLVASLGPGLDSVELRVLDARGHALAVSGRRQGGTPLHVCGGKGLRLQVLGRAGSGSYQVHFQPVPASQLDALGEIPRLALPGMLDRAAQARRKGWRAKTEPLVLPWADAQCHRAGECEHRREWTVAADTCLSVAALDASGRAVAVVLSAQGRPDASLNGAFATRCSHGGDIQMRVKATADVALLVYEHRQPDVSGPSDSEVGSAGDPNSGP